MATPPSDSRQPPDGDEFPDFIENNSESKQVYYKQIQPETVTTMEELTKPATLNFSERSSSNNLYETYDLSENLKNNKIPEPVPLHTRSQSLIDMSALSKEKNARWNQIVEQRRKGLSKLKGLVIPEATENDITPINIPEIKSINTAMLFSVPKVESSVSISQVFPPQETESPTVLPPLIPDTTSNLPKYSPAFKRKSLQVYSTSISKSYSSDIMPTVATNEMTKYCDKTSSPRASKLNDDDLNPPKSLESISSPTRSDCSFDYVSTKKNGKEGNDTLIKTHITRLEDESDNDSAVSSNQSSYNSRFSPPASPTRSCEINHFKTKEEEEDDKNSQNRMLKASSVEAINRKNILASAKCRSGKDLKVGSPVIKRKDENKAIARLETNGNICSAKTVGDKVISESKVWSSASFTTPVLKEASAISIDPPKNEVTKSSSSVTTPESVSASPPKFISRSTSVPNCLTPRRSLDSKDIGTPRPYTSVLRKSTPINVKALTQNFENFGTSPPPLPQKVPAYKSQVTSRNVKADILKTESKISTNHKTALKNVAKPEFKAKFRDITPLTLEKKNEDLNNSNKLSTETVIVLLRLEHLGSSLGITLAGGVDENREITIHRIRYGSLAYHDGRLKRGDKVISINRKPTGNLSHAEAGELLKKQTMEFAIEIQEGTEMVPSTPNSLSSRRSSSMSILTEIKTPAADSPPKQATHVISFAKDGSGLGFSIEGGKESPQGDVPLLIKKIFTGGAADKHGELKIGDEILKINDISFLNLTRIEAWNLMKKISDGTVNIHIYRKC